MAAVSQKFIEAVECAEFARSQGLTWPSGDTAAAAFLAPDYGDALTEFDGSSDGGGEQNSAGEDLGRELAVQTCTYNLV